MKNLRLITCLFAWILVSGSMPLHAQGNIKFLPEPHTEYHLSVGAPPDAEVAREAAGLGAENPALHAFLARSEARGAPRDFVLGVLRGAKELRSQGLPMEPYLLKANEGLAKGVAPARIFPALQHSREQTTRAAELVDRAAARGAPGMSRQARERAILQYQGALLNGIPPQRLEALSVSPPAGASGPGSITELGSAAHAMVSKRVPISALPPGPAVKLPERNLPSGLVLERKPSEAVSPSLKMRRPHGHEEKRKGEPAFPHEREKQPSPEWQKKSRDKNWKSEGNGHGPKQVERAGGGWGHGHGHGGKKGD